MEKSQEKGSNEWRTDTPPQNKEILLLCVLFNEDIYRTLRHDKWGTNRTIMQGRWNGCYFEGKYHHSSGDPFYQVVAWKEIDWGTCFYPRCIGTCK